MKISITDVCGSCCPDNVDIGRTDEEMNARIKSRVMAKIGAETSAHRHIPLKTALLALAAAALLTTAAFAAAGYVMNSKKVNETVTGRWYEVDDDGKVITDVRLYAPEAGLVLTFTGPEEKKNLPEFRAFWLPSEPDCGYTDEDGWTNYLTDSGELDDIPYVLQAYNVDTEEMQYILSGDVNVVSEESWGTWQVITASSDYSGSKDFLYKDDRANYVLMFEENYGYLMYIGGTSDMDTLVHIAKELEIRESDTPSEETDFISSFSGLDVARG